MKHKLVLPFAVSCVLSVGIGWALRLLTTRDYLRGSVRYLVIGCAVLLLAAVWAAFIGEILDCARAAREERVRAKKEQTVETLTTAAALDTASAEPAEEADAPHLPEPSVSAEEPAVTGPESQPAPQPEPAVPNAAESSAAQAPAAPVPDEAAPQPEPSVQPAQEPAPAAAPSAGSRPSARESARALHAQAEAAKREQELQRIQEGASRRLAEQAARRKAEQEKLEAQRQKALEQAAQIQQARRQKNGNS